MIALIGAVARDRMNCYYSVELIPYFQTIALRPGSGMRAPEGVKPFVLNTGKYIVRQRIEARSPNTAGRRKARHSDPGYGRRHDDIHRRCRSRQTGDGEADRLHHAIEHHSAG